MLGPAIAASVCLFAIASTSTAQEPDPIYDFVLLGGDLIDGTNAPRHRADVAVSEGRIVAIGAVDTTRARRTIDVTGMVVAPGFIDLHAHADLVALRRPEASNFVAMGVTTIITGNCGGSVDDVADHLQKVEAGGIGVNYGTLIGHGTVRAAVMGTADRAPTDTELAAMKERIGRAMEAGCFGMSTGLIYVPGTYAGIDELVALSEVVAEHGGLYVSHMRNEGDGLLGSVREALTIGRRAGLPVHLSHLKASGRHNWGASETLAALLREERAAGTRVTGDQYAYTASSTSLDVLFPSEALAIGRTAFCTKLAEDESFRAAMHDALSAGMKRSGFGDLDYAQIASAPGTADVAGLRIPAVAEHLVGGREQTHQADAVIELMIRSKGRRIQMVYHKMAEPDVERIMALPFVAVASDSGIRLHETADKPHPRGAGNNPRVLAHYVRERNVLELELAIHKMTGLPATIFGLLDRGVVAVDRPADLVVFDPQTVRDAATYAEPTAAPVGLPWVFVNGAAVIADGQPTRARPGVVLRRTAR